MKQFYVSNDCNACGECILQTNLLQENAAGYAVPTADGFIKPDELAEALKISESCPAHALSIVDRAIVGNSIEILVSEMEDRMKAVPIPLISRNEIKYDEKAFSMPSIRILEERQEEYSSRRAAESAGRELFRQLFWERRKDFALKMIVQYKSKVLRQYLDLRHPNDTYYASIGQQMETILGETKAALMSTLGEGFSLPKNFTVFQPESDLEFRKTVKEKYDTAESKFYVNSFFDGFDKNKFTCLSHYESFIHAQEKVEFTGKDWLGNNKIKTTYFFINATSTGKDLIKDIAVNLKYPREYGLLSIDAVYEQELQYVIEKYRKLVDITIKQKVSDLKSAINKCG